MFRFSILKSSRTIPSPPQSSSFLHTSATRSAQTSKQTGLRTKKANIAQQEQRLEEADANRPSVVLGTRPQEEAQKWKNCHLYKILVNEEELYSTPNMVQERTSVGIVNLPQQFSFGVDEAEKKMLFEALPITTVGMAHANSGKRTSYTDTPQAYVKEALKANLVAKALDLRNANAAGIAFENRRRIIRAFSTPENPLDTGRTEVQVALLTYKIRNLWKHLTSAKCDVGNRLGLRKLIHERAKLLRYLKGESLDRYEMLLEQLALEPESVEGELVV